MKLSGLIPNFHIYVYVSDLYIPRIGPPIFLQQNRQTDRGNIQIAHRHMNVEIGMGLRPRNSFSVNIIFEFSVLCLCSVQSNSASLHKRTIPLDMKYKGDLSYSLFHTLCMSVSNDSWILESQKELVIPVLPFLCYEGELNEKVLEGSRM